LSWFLKATPCICWFLPLFLAGILQPLKDDKRRSIPLEIVVKGKDDAYLPKIKELVTALKDSITGVSGFNHEQKEYSNQVMLLRMDC
jgi:hypothetical protein